MLMPIAHVLQPLVEDAISYNVAICRVPLSSSVCYGVRLSGSAKSRHKLSVESKACCALCRGSDGVVCHSASLRIRRRLHASCGKLLSRPSATVRPYLSHRYPAQGMVDTGCHVQGCRVRPRWLHPLPRSLTGVGKTLPHFSTRCPQDFLRMVCCPLQSGSFSRC